MSSTTDAEGALEAADEAFVRHVCNTANHAKGAPRRFSTPRLCIRPAGRWWIPPRVPR